MESDVEFYTRRAFEERQAADRAISPEAKKTHQDLSATYMRKAQESATKADEDA